MKRPWCSAELPMSAGEATRRVSGGRMVGAPSGCRELRSAAACGSVLLVPGAVHRQALLPGRGPSTEARHTTQGTGATGPAGTGKPVGWSPAGGPAAGASRDLDELAVKPVSRNRTRGVARRGTDQFQLTTRGSQLTPGRWRRGDATSPAQPKRGEGSGGVAFTSLVLCQSFSTAALSKA